ncbi:mobile mystery protein B [Rhodohalobacter mucosus]|uniref:Mobile mystery protein B n=1 Tax=Rhodohalobacter mucosus TaxID=2079485 RepID=A0A316TL14_9BACT|nr:mobile mystery protein B [Rhodohalobacter mucosus]PWN05253.1 mobile mystery protein B [Rhodohalobacter mucosus]
MFDYPDGATPIDENEKEGLLIPYISTLEELNEWEQRNITDAYSWLDRTRRKDYLSEEFIRKLHEAMFGKVWVWAGEYRRTDKNIGVDWAQIPVHFRQLLGDVRYWIDYETYSPDEIAARFHHRMVQIHLFPNGNGRHARVMTDVLLQKVLDQEPFTWGSGNLIEKGDVRAAYIKALRSADVHNYQPLLDFVRS